MSTSTGVLQLAERFCQELRALGGDARIAENAEQAARLVTDCLRDWQAGSVATSKVVSAAFPAVVQALAGQGVAAHMWTSDILTPQGMAKIPAGLVLADIAIASTGSLVLVAGIENGRSLSLLPPAIIVLVPASHLVATRSEAFSALATQKGLPSGVSFITGPSRTADIESDLSIGVHGPGRVTAIVTLGS